MEQVRVTLENRIELDVVDTGPRDGPALIFLHGFPESHRTWRRQIAHFSDRYRCIAPDQRGYHGSSKPEGVENYTPDKLIGDVFLLADALAVERFTIVGHDWGGALAWGVAMRGQQNRVERAILCNAAHPLIYSKLLWTDAQQRAAGQYMRVYRDTSRDDEIRERGLLALLEGTENATGALPDDDSEERAAIFEDWSDGKAAIGMLNWYRATPMAVPPADAPLEIPANAKLPKVPKLTIPTLVVWAMDDHALSPGNIERLEDHVEDLTLVRIEDCGHFLLWQEPEQVNAAMESFLATHLQPRSP
ncbi:alpha/beta fold hydrolase [Erythrobacter litoralis]|uniref:Alpha/beta hydrolase fold n=1 Tax=Erythrobacter litoralis (strain HTCC2594) TaxID=314225 RepID=Q2NCH7_ERYLH|nr:alpha/beta hydrolase [Erythrobacter litoralis]ABC62614.1 Alpha/beta hydrolase fold [Erythrobacter litoralis HTCC2594]